MEPPHGHEFTRVVLAPGRLVRAEVARECLAAPRAERRCRDRREGRERAVLRRVAQRADQRAVPAHRVTEEAAARRVGRKMRRDQLRQLARHVRIHPVMRRPRRLGRIDIEPRAESEIPVGVVARQSRLSRAGIGRDEHEAELGGESLRAGLDHEGLVGTGQSREVIEHRHRTVLRLRRLVDGEAHPRGALARVVAHEPLRAAEAGVLGEDLHRGEAQNVTTLRIDSQQMNFYENLETLEGFSQRGFISPIADNALFFYSYHLLGQMYTNGHSIYKIEVTPKRKTDPAYAGIIYITDDGYRIFGLQLMLTKANGVEFLDTFRVEQEYFYPDPEHIVLLTTRFSFTYDFFSVRGNGYFHAHYSNYALNPEFPDNFFTGEVTKIEAGANKQDSVFWEKTRPMQLTEEEQQDYFEKDALALKKETRAWQDSADHEFNKFKFGQFITGYDYRNSHLHLTASSNPIFDMLQFNTIEGYVVQPRFNVRYTPNDSITWEYGATVRYGSAKGGCLFSGSIGLRFDPFHKGRATLQGGSSFRQFNPDGIVPLFNTAYTLLLEENYLKAYGQDYIQVDVERELFTNGLYMRSGVQYAHRYRLQNAPELEPWIQYEKIFADNNTFQTAEDILLFTHPIPDIFTTYIEARYIIKQTYIAHPTEKFILSPKYPILQARLQFSASPDSIAQYHYVLADMQVEDNISLKLAGSLQFTFRYAHQFASGEMDIADQLHAAGNATIFSRLTETGFLVLPYYVATTDTYLSSAHVQWHLDGFLFRKLPLFKQLRLDPVFTVNALHSPDIPMYIECAAGVEHLFNIMRVDAAFVPYAGSINAFVPPFRLLIGFGF